jgi:FkbM family methyltransferase
MMPFETDSGTNFSHFLYSCVWEEILAHTGQVGRDKTAFLEQFYFDLCAELDMRLCIEIGAYEARGLHRLRTSLPDATLLAYEANPYVHEWFADRLDKSIVYVNKIVAHDDKPKTLMIPRVMPIKDGKRTLPRQNLTSSIHPRNLENVEYEEVTVASTSVDEIIANHPAQAPAAIWIDVEGAAGDVLFGAKEALKKDIAVLYIELEKTQAWKGQWTAEDISRHLNEYRFIPLARDMQTPWQYNQLYVKQNVLEKPNVISLFRRFLASLLSKDETRFDKR